MRRFFRLVKNEYIKNFKLISVRLMMMLVIIAAIGIPVLFKVIDYVENQSYSVAYNYYSIEDELDHYNYDYEYGTFELTRYAKEYTAMLQSLIDGGAESQFDWRYIVMNDIFAKTWSKAEESAYDDEFYEYEANVMEGIDGYTEEELSAMLDEKTNAALDALKAQDSYAIPAKIVKDNDLTAWYNYLIDQAAASKPGDKNDPDYDLNCALSDLDVWFYTYLSDNNIYYGIMDDEGSWASWAAGDLYDKRFYDIKNIYEQKKIIVYYEHGQESASSYKRAADQLALYEYTTENNITYNIADHAGGSLDNISSFDMWSVPYITSMAMPFVGLLAIVIAAMSVASEFSNGTIKFLLINPVKRWKILVSKYFTVISISYIMIALMCVMSLITSMILFDGSLITANYITAENGNVIVTSGLLFLLKTYLISSVQVVVMATMAFAISVLMKSSAFAIGISMLGMLAGSTIINVLAMFNQGWARYLIFANLNLASISRGQSTFMYQTVGSACAVIAVHMVLLWLIAWDGFTRREI